MVATATKTTAFIYIRVSTPSQEVDEQVRMIRQYAADNNIEIIGQYGDYQKRHKSHQRHSFQAMLNDLEAHKPNLILVQRLDRFGTADSNELGYFLTILKRGGVRLITAIDGKDRSKGDLETVIVNTVGASQSRQECALRSAATERSSPCGPAPETHQRKMICCCRFERIAEFDRLKWSQQCLQATLRFGQLRKSVIGLELVPDYVVLLWNQTSKRREKSWQHQCQDPMAELLEIPATR